MRSTFLSQRSLLHAYDLAYQGLERQLAWLLSTLATAAQLVLLFFGRFTNGGHLIPFSIQNLMSTIPFQTENSAAH